MVKRRKRKLTNEKTCVICGTPLTGKQVVLCGKKACKNARTAKLNRHYSSQKSKTDFSKGIVWTLDMKTWEWAKEVRGN